MKPFAFLLFIFIIPSLPAQTVATINAPNMRYQLTSPPGWYFFQSAYETGRISLLIPDGETWRAVKTQPLMLRFCMILQSFSAADKRRELFISHLF